MKVKEHKTNPNYKKILVISNGGTLRIATYAIPGWKVFIDGKEVRFTSNNKFKLIDIAVPKGDYTVEAKFTSTIYATIGNILSLTGVLILLAGIIYFRNQRYEHKKI